MKLKGTPGKVINRFGNKYKADNEGYLIANNKEELEVFIAYGFELEEEPKQVKTPLKTKK